MEKQEFKILFLDDEIYEEDDNPAIIAKKTLEQAGYTIEVTDKMSDVITASRRNYYHLYLLDIDMGNVEDEFDGNGATVGEVLRKVSSIRNVVVYSARGKVSDWTKAANYHFYYYVHKDWGEEKLLEVVDEVFESTKSTPMQIPVLQNEEYSDSVLIYYEKCQMSFEYINSKFENLIIVDSLSKMVDSVKLNNPKLVLIVFPHVPKSDLPKLKTFEENLIKAMAVQPLPNAVVCLEATPNGKRFLNIVNMHPFRIVNIELSDFERQFEEAVNSAVKWYGDKEIFDFPDENQINYKPMTEQEIDELRPEDWQYDEWEDWQYDEWEEGEYENDKKDKKNEEDEKEDGERQNE